MNIGATGKNGEDRVADFLIKQGAAVIYRNFVCKKGEIDIIAEESEYIVFVEVKTRKENSIIPFDYSIFYDFIFKVSVYNFKIYTIFTFKNSYIFHIRNESIPHISPRIGILAT